MGGINLPLNKWLLIEALQHPKYTSMHKGIEQLTILWPFKYRLGWVSTNSARAINAGRRVVWKSKT